MNRKMVFMCCVSVIIICGCSKANITDETFSKADLTDESIEVTYESSIDNIIASTIISTESMIPTLEEVTSSESDMWSDYYDIYMAELSAGEDKYQFTEEEIEKGVEAVKKGIIDMVEGGSWNLQGTIKEQSEEDGIITLTLENDYKVVFRTWFDKDVIDMYSSIRVGSVASDLITNKIEQEDANLNNYMVLTLELFCYDQNGEKTDVYGGPLAYLERKNLDSDWELNEIGW